MPTTIDASFIDSLPPNVAVQFLERVAKSPHREAFRYPEGDGWTSVTWKQAGDDVAKIAAGLLALGIQAEQRVGISSGTRYEWILADLGIMCAGAATTTVSTRTTPTWPSGTAPTSATTPSPPRCCWPSGSTGSRC